MTGPFDFGAITPSRYFIGIAVLLGVLFALISPDSEQPLAGLQQLLLWQVKTLGPIALLVGCHLLLHRWQRFERLNPWWQLICSGLLGVLLFSPLSLQLDCWFEQEFVASGQWGWALLDEYRHLVLPVVISWVAINAPWLLGFRLERRELALEQPAKKGPAAVTTAVPAPDFMQLVPVDVRGEIICLKAELHYLTVVTVKGKALILYNLKDAIAELPLESGLQPHRSYWVACRFIVEFHKVGRQGALELSDGQRIPVSRRNVAKVDELNLPAADAKV